MAQMNHKDQLAITKAMLEAFAANALRTETTDGAGALRTLVEALLSAGKSLKIAIVVLIPAFYNPTIDGTRTPVETAKIVETEREIQEHFSGFSRSMIDGWYRDDTTNDEYWDRLHRFEILLVPRESVLAFFQEWKELLCHRFEQRDIYIEIRWPVVLL